MEIDGETVRNLFPLNEDLSFVNHGSFGVVPYEVSAARKRFLDEFDKEPDLWSRITSLKHFDKAADLIADLYNAPPEQLTLVVNATTGVQCALNNLNIGAGDSILVTDLTYGTIVEHAQWLAKKVGADIHVLRVEFPFTHDSIVRQYTEALQKMEGNCKVAVIDHITCTGALLMPMDRLIPLCRQFNTVALIDGAHAPGHLSASEMDMAQLQPDFYVGNLHKWSFVPRPCAMFYVAQRYLDIMRPQVTSWLINYPFRLRFAFLGTGDLTHIAAIPAALEFVERLGGHVAIRSYAVDLLRQGIELLTTAFGAERICEEQYSAPMMVTIYLGPAFDAHLDLLRAWRETTFQDKLYLYMRKLKISLNTIFEINGRMAARITAYVYNTLDDFRALVQALLQLRRDFATMSLEDALNQEDPPLNE